MKLSSLTPYLIHDFKSESDLIKASAESSTKFTRDRENISDYLNDPRLVSAYTVFYLLTNMPKLQEVFKWMPSAWIEELKNCDLVDLGAGPGTFSLAWKEMGGAGDFYQIETSKLMKEQGKKIWQGLYSDQLFQSSRWEGRSEKPRFLIFGHSANEMGPELATRYIKEINPDHILFIEPGTKEFFPKMLSIRDHLLKNNFNVLYPCPEPLACPMEGTSDWCHQFIHVRQDPEIERISQMAKLDRKLLPLTVQAYSRTFSYSNPSERVVRVLPETKFSHEWEVCHNNELQHYQLMKRDMSKQDSRALSSLLAGEAVVTKIIKNVEKARRVRLQNIVKP
mgnify:FL=1